MNQTLTSWFKFRFALAELGFTALRAVLDFYLLYYYTDVVNINPALAGSALLVAKLTWDAVNDPLFGYISDRTKSLFGRRRIYMVAAALPLGLSTWILFSIPKGLTGLTAFLVLLASFLLLDTFNTMAGVPYAALIAEVTQDYQERSSLGLYKGGNAVVGYILGAAGITFLVQLFENMGLNLQKAWSGAGAVIGVLVMVTLLLTTFSVKESHYQQNQPVTIPPIKSVLLCFNNKPFIWLMIIFMLGSFAFTMQAALLPYLIQYQLGMQDQISYIMIVSLATTGIFIFPAKWIADRINKGPAYALGMAIAAITFLAAFLFLPHHATPWVYGVAVFLGIGFSMQWVIPYAILPDVIEYDEKATGKRREGIYYGITNFLDKLAIALGTAVPGWALAWFGYIPNIAQTEHALFGIRFFYAVVPAIVFLLCLPLLIWFPITKHSHAILRDELAVARKEKSNESF